jgi:hypothetical protein
MIDVLILPPFLGSDSCLYPQSLNFTIKNADRDGSSSTVSFPVHVCIYVGVMKPPSHPLSPITHPSSDVLEVSCHITTQGTGIILSLPHGIGMQPPRMFTS